MKSEVWKQKVHRCLCLCLGWLVGWGLGMAGRALVLGGGGYLDICTSAEFQKKKAATPQKNGAPRDPRLNDLRRIGLQSVWLDVAEEIGVDAFMRIWRIIDAAPECAYNDTALRVPIRMYRVFLRFQRNQYIRELSGAGLSFSAIKRRVARQLGEQVSIRHIKRIAASE